MKKCFRYLLMFNASNYIAALAFAGIILGGCYITGVPAEGRGLFYGYFNMFPSMLLMVALFSGTAYCSTSLNHALSYGARREDYFWGLQLLIALNTAVYSLMCAAFLAMPDILSWSEFFTGTKYSQTFPLTLLMVHAVGCALGRLYTKSRLWAGLVTGVAMFLLLLNPIFDTISAHTGSLWGDLPWMLISGTVLVTFLCQFWTYGVIKTATVR